MPAEIYAKDNDGRLIEVGFVDGADNPLENSGKANLTFQSKKPFELEFPYHHYDVYYSYDETFRIWQKHFNIKRKKQIATCF